MMGSPVGDGDAGHAALHCGGCFEEEQFAGRAPAARGSEALLGALGSPRSALRTRLHGTLPAASMMLRSAMVLAQLHAVLALAVSRAGAPLMALSGPEQLQAMNIARNLLGSQTLPQCTVVVAGGNGRVGASVCRNLLRNHPLVSVRALIRNADDIMSYEYLSYEVGAEDAKGTIRPAWAALADGEPRISFEFDEEVQGTYGLDRLSLCECELRYKPDVERALQGADAVIYCASAFDANRRKNPERLQARAILAQFWRNSGAVLRTSL